MLARVTAFVSWAIVAAVVVFWALKLMVRAPAAPSFTVPVSEATAVRGDLSRLFGKTMTASTQVAAAPELASRFKLIGVMAPKPAPGQPASDAGLALIAVDGKPPRAFAPGSRIDGELVLQSVSLRTAAIGPAQGAAALTLEVPRLPAPATGTLGPVVNSANPVPPRPVPPPAAAPMAQPSPMAAPVPVPPPPGTQAAIDAAVPPQGVPTNPPQMQGGNPPVPQRGTFTQ